MKIFQFKLRIFIGCSLCFLLILSVSRYKVLQNTSLLTSIRSISVRSYNSRFVTGKGNGLNISTQSDESKSATHKQGEKFNYLINEDRICNDDNSSSVTLLVGVFSGLSEKPLRDFVRSKWGAIAKNSSKIRLIFILGTPEDASFNMTSVQEESRLYHDIIQADFIDTYRGLLLKSLALFSWAQSYCKSAKFLLKIDSDMQIDLKQLVALLEKGDVADKFQCGEMNTDAYPVRNRNNKWYVSTEMFSGRKFPFYCQGAAYVVSKRIANKIADLPIPKKLFPIDDVYMTGVLRITLKEDIEQKHMSYHHHYKATDTKVTKDRFSKFIMTIDVH